MPMGLKRLRLTNGELRATKNELRIKKAAPLWEPLGLLSLTEKIIKVEPFI